MLGHPNDMKRKNEKACQEGGQKREGGASADLKQEFVQAAKSSSFQDRPKLRFFSSKHRLEHPEAKLWHKNDVFDEK